MLLHSLGGGGGRGSSCVVGIGLPGQTCLTCPGHQTGVALDGTHSSRLQESKCLCSVGGGGSIGGCLRSHCRKLVTVSLGVLWSFKDCGRLMVNLKR